MGRKSNQKQKLLYIMRILLEKTDENHVLNTTELISELKCYGIEAERKALYDDIEALRVAGFDVNLRIERPSGYYIGSREFELAELKLLVDAVSCSRFITAKKSAELVTKLAGLASCYEAKQLKRQIISINRVKAVNESIYYNVDLIHSAIAADVMVRFNYGEWNTKKELSLRKGGKLYQISPAALMWDDENYYLAGYDKEENKIKHYRVDKMMNVEHMEKKREGGELILGFDTASLTQKSFGMYGGEETEVKLSVDNELIGVILDRFGKDISIREEAEGTSIVRVAVYVSRIFYGWIAGLGGGVRILGPQHVVDDYRKLLYMLLNGK